MVKFVALLSVLAVISCRVNIATSCSCMGLPSVKDYFCRSSFVALVTITGEPANCSFYTNCYPFKLVRPLKVLPDQIKKGLLLNATSIRTSQEESLCGYNFQPNEDYIISGYINNNGEIVTHLCNYIQRWARMSKIERERHLALFEPKLVCHEVEDI
ncbi:hypothetical protein HDE_04055 [Halotydeus destructor]|nr:hypothetical protein HDE_04055 [Halotydeus destructor]